MMSTAVSNKSTLIIVCGLIGTGKTILAKILAERLGCAVISSDVLRKRLAEIPEMEHRYGEYEEGIYSPDFTATVYLEMVFTEVPRILGRGGSIILDASFGKRLFRSWAREMAQNEIADFLAVECRLDEAVVKERLVNRGETVSDGRWEIYLEQKKVFEPVVEIPPEEHIVVDTSRPVGDIVGEILWKVKGKK
jgi:predicted kinase